MKVRHRLRDVQEFGPFGRTRTLRKALAGIGDGDNWTGVFTDDVIKTDADVADVRRRGSLGFAVGGGRLLERLTGGRPDSEVVGVVQRQQRRQVDDDVVVR